MATLVHVSPLLYAGTGSVRLRIDTSGDPPPGGVVTVSRRVAGEEETEPIIPAAGYLSATAAIHLINGTAVLTDTSAPLDVPVEYLAGLPGQDQVVATDPITVPSGGVWRLGDPLRPYLDLTLTLTRAAPAPWCPESTGAKIILGLSEDSLDMQSEVFRVPGSRTPLTSVEPIASPVFEIRFATRSHEDRLQAEAIFAPGGNLLLRVPANYQFEQRYLTITSVRVERISPDHRRPWRVFTVQAKECDQPPGASYGWVGARWADLCPGSYPDWAAVLAAGLSWASLGSGVAGGGFPSVMRSYAEVDSIYATYAALSAAVPTYADLAGGT